MCFICKYCGKEVGNKGALINHEIACNLNTNKVKNPNRKGNGGHNNGNFAWNKGLTQETSKSIKNGHEKWMKLYKEGKIKFNPHKWTGEEKENLSKKRKQWLLDHKDQHVWRRDSKFLSEPCEHLKKYLKDKGINFIEEYEPFNDVNYCVDIAWPDEKIAIEVNGNQHYNRDGSLSKYYQKRHNLFKERGWRIFEIHYSKCFNINLDDFNDILKLPIYDKDYVGKYFSKKEIRNKQKLELEKIQKEQQEIKNRQKQEIEEQHKQIIYNLINNSGINFTQSGWSTKAYNYLLERNELWNKGILRCIRKYYPEFLQRNDVYIRKGSKI